MWPFGQAVEKDAAVTLVESRIKAAVDSALMEVTGALKEREELSKKVAELQETISKLKIQSEEVKAANARNEAEIEHRVGLHKKRVEFEIEQAKNNALIEVREQNLKKAEEGYEAQMRFNNERFEKEVGYLKDILTDLMGRLPRVNFEGEIAPRRKRLPK